MSEFQSIGASELQSIEGGSDGLGDLAVGYAYQSYLITKNAIVDMAVTVVNAVGRIGGEDPWA
jgi:hypothetical protein